jgi:hypothetical protein
LSENIPPSSKKNKIPSPPGQGKLPCPEKPPPHHLRTRQHPPLPRERLRDLHQKNHRKQNSLSKQKATHLNHPPHFNKSLTPHRSKERESANLPQNCQKIYKKYQKMHKKSQKVRAFYKKMTKNYKKYTFF